MPTLISVLIPALNEEDNIERCYDRVVAVFAALPEYEAEIIVNDNHSTDRTFAILAGIAARDPRVRVYRFSRNVGYGRSVLHAYQCANGACAVQIDSDMQDPPELIPKMLAIWKEGNDVVYGIRRSLPDGPVVAMLRRGFYALIARISPDDLPRNAGEFRLVDRRILDQLRLIRDRSPYVRGLISSMGFQQVGFDYDRAGRVAGQSKFSFRPMLSLAVDALVNHSLLPLRLASNISLVVGTLTFLLAIFYVIGRLLFGQAWPAGFATTTVLLLLSITLNAMFLGIIGEYVGRIFMQTKDLHAPIVEASLNTDGTDWPEGHRPACPHGTHHQPPTPS